MLLLLAAGQVAAGTVRIAAEEVVRRVALEVATIRVLVPVETERHKFIGFI